jgi:hypothetical protein
LLELTNTKQTQQYYRMLETSRKNYKKEQDKGHHNREDKEIWQGKGMHGQFPCSLDERFMDNEQSY